MKHVNFSMLATITISISLYNQALANTEEGFLEPPMVSIPAGEFYMGSDRGNDDEKPVHKVTVPAFQMGKFEVTLAEYRKFVQDTQYQGGQNCNHRIGQRWFGSGENDGDWENNIYANNEFYPVVCVSRQDAINYAKWLSEKTAKHYRLPTEAEWEYTLRAGTTGRYFYGDESLSANACDYANLSDYHAANMTGKLYDAPYSSNYIIQPCNDNEVLLSVVGLYQPNPFGVHDMLGNVVERLADCYVDNYNDAPNDGSAVALDDCKVHVARGGSWHWEAFTASQRMPMSNDFLAALEGFRLVLDTQGITLPSQPGSETFRQQLDKAQLQAKMRHTTIEAYPEPPTGLRVIRDNNPNISPVKIVWEPDSKGIAKHYKVLRQNLSTNETQLLTASVKTPFYLDANPPKGIARYQVIAVNGQSESRKSQSVDSGVGAVHRLPQKVEGEAFSSGEGVEVRASVMEPEHDKIFSAIGTQEVRYEIEVPVAGRYEMDARVYYSSEPQEMTFWLGDKRLLTEPLEGEMGWHTVDKLLLNLPEGNHSLRVSGSNSRFSLNWMNIKAVSSNRAKH